MNVFEERKLDSHFSKGVLDVLRAMSFPGGGVLLHGSAIVRSQQYFGDYDGVQRVKVKRLSTTARDFGTILKRLRAMPNVRIGDIKCGEVDEWNVLGDAKVVDGKIVGFNVVHAKTVLDGIKWSSHSPTELDAIRTPFDLLDAKKTFKDHVVRWTPSEVIAGEKTLNDGRRYTLEEGFKTGMTKLDVVAIVNARAVEFSLIYEFEMNGTVLNPLPTGVADALREDILYYSKTNPFKALKRRFALAKIEKDIPTGRLLTPILNSDLGRLYRLVGRVKTLADTDLPTSDLLPQVDLLREDLGSLFTLTDVLRKDSELIGRLNEILRHPVKSKFPPFEKHLQAILNHNTRVLLS